MDHPRRGGAKKSLSLLLLLLSCLTNQDSPCVEAASEDDYAMMLQNQGFSDDAANSRTKLVSSLSHLLEQDEEEKRSSSFYPLRGKKLSDSSVADHYQAMPDQEDKRSQFYPLRGKKIPDDLKRASSFMPMRGRKDDEWELTEEESRDDSLDKRASSFMPMRGKKRIGGASNAYQHFGKPGTYPSVKTEITFPYNNDRIPEKKMSSFIPVRGKKSAQDTPGEKTEPSLLNLNSKKVETNHLQHKRSISFTPMRGRRLLSLNVADSDSVPPGDIVTSLLEKKHYSFMPMRGRRTFYLGESKNPLPNSLREEVADFPVQHKETQDSDEQKSPENFHYEDYPDHKRASSFMPMRGRKDDFQNPQYSPLEIESTEDKRKSSFMPMRGRKSVLQSSNLEANDMADTFEQKKASSFMPMRGRRELEMPDDVQFPLYESDKRASSFMPMRGKKESESFDFVHSPLYEQNKRASSFMPMRGRRGIADDFSNASLLRNSEDVEKRLSFMPMRGRRFLTSGGGQIEPLESLPRSTFEMNGSYDVDDLEENNIADKRGYAFMPMRGRRSWASENDQPSYYYNPFPYFVPTGIGSAFISKPFASRDMFVSSARATAAKKRRLYDWDSVKRAFHATRGKRFHNENLKDPMKYSLNEEQGNKDDNVEDKSFRFKRNIFRPQVAFKPQRKYLALKRPMSFFATRGKRLDQSSIDKASTQP